MAYIKVNGSLYPATISGKMSDKEWDGRPSKSIRLKMTYNEALSVFVDGVKWSIVQRDEIPVEVSVYEINENGEVVLDENSVPVLTGIQPKVELHEIEFDNSDYILAGDIIDHRDGMVTVKMGRLTELEEAYELMLGGI